MYIVLSVLHPLFPLRTCFEIFPDDPFGIVIFLSAFIRQASDIHLFDIPAIYYPYPFFSILFLQFGQFCWFLEQMKTGWRQLRTFGRPLYPFCTTLVFIVCGTGPLIKSAKNTELRRTDKGSMWWGCLTMFTGSLADESDEGVTGDNC